MDDRKKEEIIDWARDLLKNSDTRISRLDNLPYWANRPDLFDKDHLIAKYIILSNEKLWAWEGLKALGRELLQRNEPIPSQLREWIRAFLNDEISPPGTKRAGRKSNANADRNSCICMVFTIFTEQLDYSGIQAQEEIGKLINISPKTVATVIENFKKVPE